MNEDTSTNNLPEFFWYCRESVSSKSRQVFAFYYVWAFVGGAIVYLLSFNSLDNIIDPQGRVNGMWNTAVSIYCMVVITYHVQTLIEYRSYNIPGLAFWAVSLLQFMPLTIELCNSGNDAYMYSQWSVVWANPIFVLVVLLQVAIISLPRICWLALENVFWHPEFIKIKGEWKEIFNIINRVIEDKLAYLFIIRFLFINQTIFNFYF